MDAESPLVLLLVGQPTLARQLRMGIFAALDQRIATRYQIASMDLGEIGGVFLRHHLALVGRTDPLVAEDAKARLDMSAAWWKWSACRSSPLLVSRTCAAEYSTR